MKTYKTGGGPFTDVKLTGVGNRVLALIGIAAKGTNSEFDCDAVDSDTTVHNTTANVTQSEVIGEWVEMENLETVTENVPMDAAIVIEGAEVLQTVEEGTATEKPQLLERGVRSRGRPRLAYSESSSKTKRRKADQLTASYEPEEFASAAKHLTPDKARSIMVEAKETKHQYLIHRRTEKQQCSMEITPLLFYGKDKKLIDEKITLLYSIEDKQAHSFKVDKDSDTEDILVETSSTLARSAGSLHVINEPNTRKTSWGRINQSSTSLVSDTGTEAARLTFLICNTNVNYFSDSDNSIDDPSFQPESKRPEQLQSSLISSSD
ncbi:hypothetical protein RN001_012235 [Aquatica leii]|uniref:Uncharacterized protein n=1 Tax=Aquatica leii TaxID=1421715 RepID=A0AAN7P588_9COLE|nr:hypothetical protein RN001_012235 [Aquatica leii]